MFVSVVIPAYNEESTIGYVLENIPAEFEKIVVDDGSTDHTAKIARKYGAIIISHGKRFGQGFAWRTGATAANGDVLVFIDGNGRYNPRQIPNLLEKIFEADMVLGSRNLFHTRLVGRFLTKHINDPFTGFRAIWKDKFLRLNFDVDGYKAPYYLTLAALEQGYNVCEVPINPRKKLPQIKAIF